MPDNAAVARVVEGQIRLAVQYHRDAEILSAHASRNAANMLFLAVEAALIAVLTAEGLPVGRADHHQLAAMAATLPVDHPTQARISRIAAPDGLRHTFRYITPTGRMPQQPTTPELAGMIERAAALVEACRARFGVVIEPPSPPPEPRPR